MSQAIFVPNGYALMCDGIHDAGSAAMAALPIEQARLLHEATTDIEELAHALGRALDDPGALGLRRGLLLRIIALNAAAMSVLGGDSITTEALREVVRGPLWMQTDALRAAPLEAEAP